MEILRDKYGKPRGFICEIAGDQEHLYDRTARRLLPTAQTRITRMTTTGRRSAQPTAYRDLSKAKSSPS